jgi:hypothetical protein
MMADLKALNERLLARLAKAGVTPDRVIYASFDDAGSSSAAILNLLRDACGLEAKRCRFVDAGNVRKLHEMTTSSGFGAIIYVDDFIGTGNQFSKSRDFVSEYIIGNFSEFLLVHTICEEGIGELARRGSVEPLSARVHSRMERPLHELATLLTEEDKTALRRYCMGLHQVHGLGFRKLATMVVYYRNSPNTVPLLIRGSRGQVVCRGILPRTTDLDAA